MMHQPMGVKNISFFIDKMGEDIHPHQYIRELIQNSIEAGATEIRIGPHWETIALRLEKELPPVWKLAIADNGCGMTPEQMEDLLNNLFSSGKIQATDQNYGIGAKVSTLPDSPLGLMYFSWVNSKGYMCIVNRDKETNEPGLVQLDDGEYIGKVDERYKPDFIKDSGTVVVMLGHSENDNTFARGDNLIWIMKYLNDRYMTIPDHINIKVVNFNREKQSEWSLTLENLVKKSSNGLMKGSTRRAKGRDFILDRLCSHKGTIKTKQGNILWWFSENKPLSYGGSGLASRPCGTGAIWRDEIYHLRSGISARHMLERFGIYVLFLNIAIFIQPDENICRTDMPRTHLFVNHDDIDWDWWGLEFKKNIPDVIINAMKKEIEERYESEDEKGIERIIKNLLKRLGESTRYSQNKNKGTTFASGIAYGGNQEEAENKGAPGAPSAPSGGKNAVYLGFLDSDGQPATPIKGYTNVPKVIWLDKDQWQNGHTSSVIGRSVYYDQNNRHIELNKDYDFFKKQEEIVISQIGDGEIEREAALLAVREAITKNILETIVLNERLIQKNKFWNIDQRDLIFTPEVLTSHTHKILAHENSMVKKARKILREKKNLLNLE